MRETAEVLMQKGDPNRGGADNGHAEIQKLRRLQRQEGLAIMKQLEGDGDAPPIAHRVRARNKKLRRKYESIATKLFTGCSHWRHGPQTTNLSLCQQ